MPLRECMESHTHREYLTWQAFFEDEWERPSRTDNYLMQIAAEVRRVLSKRPENIKIKHFRLTFGSREKSKAPLTREQATAASQAKWLGALGMLKRMTTGKKKK